MKVLMISTDRKIFEPDSPVRRRMIEYGALFEQLHIIVFTQQSRGYAFTQIAENVWVYPTDSWMKLDYVYDALQVARHDLVIQGEFTPDIVSAQDPFEAGLVGWLIARRYKRKLQLQVHTDIYDPLFKSSLLNRLRLLIAAFLLPRAQCVRVVSARIKSEFLRRYPVLAGRIVVLPVYVDMEYYRTAKPTFDLHERYPQFSFIIMMASRLTPEKNYAVAVEAFAEVVKRYPRTGLVIVGSGPEESRIRRLAAERGVLSSIIFEGWQDDLLSYYKTANLFLHTSRYEGYGMVLVEAAAAGVPIVSSDVGVARQLAQARGDSFVCGPDDVACFVRQISDYIGNPERRAFSRLNQDNDLQGVIYESKESYLLAYREAMEACFALPKDASA